MTTDIPEFAVLGHPNEGKSSVVSTLTENDKIRIGPTPGETIRSGTYSVIIDEKEIIRFTDTPGFQVPKRTLEWFKSYSGREDRIIREFIDTHQDDDLYKDECELLTPVANGAGIIYVVDGSRPVRSDDKAEMEILRLTGRPRMAIINSKTDNTDYTENWKFEFRKHFNSIWIFNSNKANYSQRIALLESLKSIDQECSPALDKVIRAFKSDWDKRSRITARLIYEFISTCLSYSVNKNVADGFDERSEKDKLLEKYFNFIRASEKKTFEKIKNLYKHNIFEITLPEQSIVNEDLFSKKTWQFLGLTPGQLTIAAAACGAALGVWLDVAAAGMTFGVFTAIGSAMGAGSVIFGGKKMVNVKVIGLSLGGNQLTVGPNENPQFIYILLDRALIYFSHIINWAHGRRDYPEKAVVGALDRSTPKGSSRAGFASSFDKKSHNICNRFFKEAKSNTVTTEEKPGSEFLELIARCLIKISNDEMHSNTNLPD